MTGVAGPFLSRSWAARRAVCAAMAAVERDPIPPGRPSARPPAYAVALALGVVGVTAATGVMLASARHALPGMVAARRSLADAGAGLDAAGCVEAAVRAHAACDGPHSLCQAEVPALVESCLTAADRAADCATLPADASTGHLAYVDCVALAGELAAAEVSAHRGTGTGAEANGGGRHRAG